MIDRCLCLTGACLIDTCLKDRCLKDRCLIDRCPMPYNVHTARLYCNLQTVKSLAALLLYVPCQITIGLILSNRPLLAYQTFAGVPEFGPGDLG